MQRQPNVLGNLGLYYKDSMFDAALFDSFTGRTFTSDFNNIELPSYHIVRLDAGYTRTFAGATGRGSESASTICSTARPFRRVRPARGRCRTRARPISSAGRCFRGASWLDCPMNSNS